MLDHTNHDEALLAALEAVEARIKVDDYGDPEPVWEPDPDLLRDIMLERETDLEIERQAALSPQLSPRQTNGGHYTKTGLNGGDPSNVQEEAPPKKTALLPEIELTRFTKKGGPLTKRISLDDDGTLVKDGSACVMAHGVAERIKISGIAALATLIEDLRPSQAIALGSLRAGLLDKVKVTTEKSLNGAERQDIIARTGSDIVYHGPAFALLDHDDKGISPAVAAELKRAGGFWPALLTVLPSLKDTARVTRLSTSAGLSRSDTGERIPGRTAFTFIWR